MTTEHVLQNQILDYLNQLPNVFAWRNQSAGIYDPKIGSFRKKVGFDIKGVSDILGIMSPSGVLIAIEVKSESGKLSAEQLAYLNKIRRMGGVSICAHNMSDIYAIFPKK